MKNLFNRFVREESGQDIIEYVLLAAFISVVAWTIIQTIGGDVTNLYHGTQDGHGRGGGGCLRKRPEGDRRTASGRPPVGFVLRIIFVGSRRSRTKMCANARTNRSW